MNTSCKKNNNRATPLEEHGHRLLCIAMLQWPSLKCEDLTCVSGQTAAGFPPKGLLVKASTVNTGIFILVEPRNFILKGELDHFWPAAVETLL